jgi:hypothetical protein
LAALDLGRVVEVDRQLLGVGIERRHDIGRAIEHIAPAITSGDGRAGRDQTSARIGFEGVFSAFSG